MKSMLGAFVFALALSSVGLLILQVLAPLGLADPARASLAVGQGVGLQGGQRSALDRLRDLEVQAKKDGAEIERLSALLKNSGDQLNAQLNQYKKNELVWGEWHFEHTNPEGSGMVINVLSQGTSTLASKKVKFRFPHRFDTPPKIHLCVNFVAFERPLYIVQVQNVTEEGFELFVDKDKGLTSWEHLGLTWFAIPNSVRHKTSDVQILN